MVAGPRVAIVHEWLVTYAGSERVVEQLLALFPDAQLFALVDFLSESERAAFLGGRSARTTFIQHLPRAKTRYRGYLPLMPLAIEQLDLSGFDIVLSSSHAVAKGVLTGPDQLHISYVHSPIRYAWDLQHQYLSEAGLTRGPKAWLAKALLHYVRLWDQRTAHGVDHFVANSRFIARRIAKAYGRTADVIYPPVDTGAFALREDKERFYLTASRFVPYKKLPLIVEAFAQMPDRELVVIGDGPDFARVRARCPRNVRLLGFQPAAVLRDYLQRANGFVFAAEEDFGIAPVEAQASGTPVIAYGRGGALETVRGLGSSSSPTGVFFREQTPEALIAAIHAFERHRHAFSASACRANAERFSVQRFVAEMGSFVESAWRERQKHVAVPTSDIAQEVTRAASCSA